MQLTFDFLILLIYPVAAVFHFLPGHRIKVYFGVLFETLMLLTGMNYFLFEGMTISWLLFTIVSIYIVIFMITGNLGQFQIKKFGLALKIWPIKVIGKPVSSKNIFLKAVEEELIWRAAFVNLAYSAKIPIEIIITLGGILFYSVHINKYGKFNFLIESEFLAFSIFIITFYILTGSLLITILIHFFRNSILLCYRECVSSKEFY